MWFPIRYSGIYGGLCIFYAALLVMIYLIISSHRHGFLHIIWGLLGRVSVLNIFTLMFLKLFASTKKYHASNLVAPRLDVYHVYMFQ